MKTKIYILAAVVTATFTVTSVQAQSGLSDQIQYAPTSFSTTIPEGGPTEFLPAFAPAPPNTPDQAIYMYEGTPGNSVLSDVLWVQSGQLYFESDINDNLVNYPPSLPVVASVTETGQLQDLGVLLIGPSGPGSALPPGALLVSSDVDVPEPSVLSLLGMGGTALAAFLRRRKV